METMGEYKLDLEICPKEYENYATYRFGRWFENCHQANERLDDQKSSIKLNIVGYDGSVFDDAVEWTDNFPIRDLLNSEDGTWLVPIGRGGSFMICSDLEKVKDAIICLAEIIWAKTSKSPSVEAIRLDCSKQKKIRIYSFWFPFRGENPIIESQSLTL